MAQFSIYLDLSNMFGREAHTWNNSLSLEDTVPGTHQSKELDKPALFGDSVPAQSSGDAMT